MFVYRRATRDDLEKIWDKDILAHPGDERYVRWKREYINNNEGEKCITFVVLDGENPVGQITLILSCECSSVRNRIELCDGVERANMNAFRIEKEYEGQGHISKLVKIAEEEAKKRNVKFLTIGSEAKESRNLAIYLHFGYTEFVTSFTEDNELILFYGKRI